jgi:hypothetical protein
MNTVEKRKGRWFRWTFFVLFKTAIEMPFVICGPVALIACYVFGYDFADIKSSELAKKGAWLMTILFSHFCFYDWMRSVLLPWFDNSENFPIWWEDGFWKTR